MKNWKVYSEGIKQVLPKKATFKLKQRGRCDVNLVEKDSAAGGAALTRSSRRGGAECPGETADGQRGSNVVKSQERGMAQP